MFKKKNSPTITTTTSSRISVPNGSVLIGDKAYSLDYANGKVTDYTNN